MKINLSDIDADAETTSRLTGEVISFNPTDSRDVDKLLSQFGPEGLYEIADILEKAADEDMGFRDKPTGGNK